MDAQDRANSGASDPRPVFPGAPAQTVPKSLARNPALKSGHCSRRIEKREGSKEREEGSGNSGEGSRGKPLKTPRSWQR